MKCVARVPGKIVITGEYAVVAKAPGVVVATDRLATVTVETQSNPDLTCLALPLNDQPVSARWRNGALSGVTQSGQLRLIETVLQFLDARDLLPADLPGMNLTVDTRPFFDEDTGFKLGLGSSAAACTALLGALAAVVASCRPTLEQAIACHRAFQGNAGSGIDVAASFCGGVLLYKRQDQSGHPSAQPVRWPDGLFGRIVWVGQPASTTAKLARLRKFLAENPSLAENLLENLSARADSAAEAFRNSQAIRTLSAVKDFFDALMRLDRASGLGIMTPPHLACHDACQGSSVLYKTTGAGGGDLGLLLGLDRDELSVVGEKLHTLGFPCWELNVHPAGMEITGGHTMAAPSS